MSLPTLPERGRCVYREEMWAGSERGQIHPSALTKHCCLFKSGIMLSIISLWIFSLVIEDK